MSPLDTHNHRHTRGSGYPEGWRTFPSSTLNSYSVVLSFPSFPRKRESRSGTARHLQRGSDSRFRGNDVFNRGNREIFKNVNTTYTTKHNVTVTYIIVLYRMYAGCRALYSKRVSKNSVHPELVEGSRRCSWFDKLTTNGFPRLIRHPLRPGVNRGRRT